MCVFMSYFLNVFENGIFITSHMFQHNPLVLGIFNKFDFSELVSTLIFMWLGLIILVDLFILIYIFVINGEHQI
jgi:FtsH-binding integral membrane protein